MSRSSVVKIALIGAGRVGVIHLSNILELSHLFRLTSVVDDFPNKAALGILSGHPEVKLRPQSEIEEAIDESDAILVAIPTKFHASLILKAVEKNKHVFCEKPIVQTVDQVTRVFTAAEQKNLVLLGGMTRRFDPVAMRIKREVESGSLGEILRVTIVNHDNPCPPIEFLRNSPNIYYDCGVHDVDLVLWLLQESPNLVFCVGHSFDPEIAKIDDHDSGSVVMKFPSGTIVMIDFSRVSKVGFDHNYAVQGMNKSVYSQSVPETGFKEASTKGISQGCLPYSFSERFEKAFKNILKHFHDCIQGNQTPSVTGQEVIAVTLTLDAINLSRELSQPVEIDQENLKFYAKP